MSPAIYCCCCYVQSTSPFPLSFPLISPRQRTHSSAFASLAALDHSVVRPSVRPVSAAMFDDFCRPRYFLFLSRYAHSSSTLSIHADILHFINIHEFTQSRIVTHVASFISSLSRKPPDPSYTMLNIIQYRWAANSDTWTRTKSAVVPSTCRRYNLHVESYGRAITAGCGFITWGAERLLVNQQRWWERSGQHWSALVSSSTIRRPVTVTHNGANDGVNWYLSLKWENIKLEAINDLKHIRREQCCHLANETDVIKLLHISFKIQEPWIRFLNQIASEIWMATTVDIVKRLFSSALYNKCPFIFTFIRPPRSLAD